MKLATWNVNSIRARLPRVTDWLDAANPDVVCLQETKVEDADFPLEAFTERGYTCAVFGQRTYNGVAIVSRLPITDIKTSFEDGDADVESRFICATVAGIRIASLYVPNGKVVGDPKFEYKLKWLSRLQSWLDKHETPGALLALCGDYNIAPDDRDVYDPVAWQDQVLCHPLERAAYQRLLNWGLQDVFRRFHQQGGLYSWWDYRQLGFPKNRGLRIDHLLCTRALAERTQSAVVDREARKGKDPSDHAPVIIEIV
jgi:exodeoxyribonuclease III